MDLRENLIMYTEYAKGDLTKKCTLEFEDIEIIGEDFSEFDLNNSIFCGVNFQKCDFTNVYLSGSNFGGSILRECVMSRNINNKSSWDDMVFENTKVFSMRAFKTSFMFGKFQDINFTECHLESCLLSCSEFKNVSFVDCTIIDTDFSDSEFSNVQFVRCKLTNVKFNSDVSKQPKFID